MLQEQVVLGGHHSLYHIRGDVIDGYPPFAVPGEFTLCYLLNGTNDHERSNKYRQEEVQYDPYNADNEKQNNQVTDKAEKAGTEASTWSYGWSIGFVDLLVGWFICHKEKNNWK